MDDDEKLIEAVRLYPCLWQVSSRSYRDVIAKTNALKMIAEQVYNTKLCIWTVYALILIFVCS